MLARSKKKKRLPWPTDCLVPPLRGKEELLVEPRTTPAGYMACHTATSRLVLKK